MDRMIARFDAQADADLMLCQHRGVAYQRDMKRRVSYDDAYFNKCLSYEDQDISLKINAGRVALVNKYAGADGKILDVGVGSGEFIKKRPGTFGYDINPKAVNWLKSIYRYSDNFDPFDGYSFWDVIEHIEDCEPYFRCMKTGSYLFTSIPVFTDLTKIRESKHYRPGEHLYYWTEQGFVDWMRLHRFELIERQDYETQAGRDNIVSFAFRRSLPGYGETLAQYQQLHGAFYGDSAHLYFGELYT